MSDLLLKVKRPRQSSKMGDSTKDSDNSDSISAVSSTHRTYTAPSTAATSISGSCDFARSLENDHQTARATSSPRDACVRSERARHQRAASSAGGASRPMDVPRPQAASIRPMNDARQPEDSIHAMQSPLSQFIQQAELLRCYADDGPSDTGSPSSPQSDLPACQRRVPLYQNDVPSRYEPVKQYPPTSFRMDENPDAAPTRKYEPGSPLHPKDQNLLRQVRASAATDRAKRTSTTASNRAYIISHSPSLSLPAGSDRVQADRGRSNTRTQDTSEGTHWTDHSVPTTRRRRRSSLQRMKDAANQLVDGIKEGADKVRHSISAHIDMTVSQRQPHPAELQDAHAPSITTTSSTEPNESNPTPKPPTTNLPSAEEVYSKKTHFTKCPHTSPPAHTPLNQSHRSVRLAPGLLRYPTSEHHSHLAAQAQNPHLRPLKINILRGRCAACDLQHRRALETEAIRFWNGKHNIFALRLYERRGAGKTAAALQAKLADVRARRDQEVVAIWSGFKARWGVSPAGIVPQREEQEEQEQHHQEWEVATSSIRPETRSTETRSIETGTSAGTGVGFMRNGRHGGPMDHVREPGRMRLSWNSPAAPLRAPKGYVRGEGREWTDEERRLLAREPWEAQAEDGDEEL